MDTVLWIAIGLSAGWTTSKLMLSSGDRLVSGMVAGAVGALLGGLSMRLLDPTAQSGPVNTAVAALAGALWLTWVVCVVVFGRQTDDERSAPVDSYTHLHGGRDMLTYAAARDSLVEQLLRDAAAHDAERYDEVGRRFDSLEREFRQRDAPELTRLHVALAFWDGWIDARNRGWLPAGGISKADWSLLARGVAADLTADRAITDARVCARFDASAHQSVGDRVQTLAARLGRRSEAEQPG